MLPFGSTVNGLASRQSSDLDLTLLCKKGTDYEKVLQRVKKALLTKSEKFEVGEEMPLRIKAGWLLTFKDKARSIDVDILLNKHSEILNSFLLAEYALIDPRFHKLAIYLKQWNRRVQQNKALRLNSFSINLMLVAFM